MKVAFLAAIARIVVIVVSLVLFVRPSSTVAERRTLEVQAGDFIRFRRDLGCVINRQTQRIVPVQRIRKGASSLKVKRLSRALVRTLRPVRQRLIPQLRAWCRRSHFEDQEPDTPQPDPNDDSNFTPPIADPVPPTSAPVCWFGNIEDSASHTSDIQVSSQNDYYPFDLSGLGVGTRTFTIGGHWLEAGQDLSLQGFIDTPRSAVTARIRRLKEVKGIPALTTDTLVIDIENPHPADLGEIMELSGLAFVDQLIESFKMRVEELRSEFPLARISLYGVVVPMAGGQYNSAFQKQLLGLQRMQQAGVFDQLSALSPVLYFRKCQGDLGYSLNSLATYLTTGGIEAANFTRLDGSPLLIIPYLNLRVANSQNSTSCVGMLVPQEEISAAVDVLQSLSEISAIVFWTGSSPQTYSSDVLPAMSGLRNCAG